MTVKFQQNDHSGYLDVPRNIELRWKDEQDKSWYTFSFAIDLAVKFRMNFDQYEDSQSVIRKKWVTGNRLDVFELSKDFKANIFL